jgi:hypothetical protein
MTEQQDYTEAGIVPVHIASAAYGTVPGQAKRRCVAIYKTVILTADNPWEQIVNENPNRYCFTVVAGQTNGAALASDLLIGSNQGDIARYALSAEAAGALPGTFLPAKVVGVAPVPFHGQNATWIAALQASPSFPLYVGITDFVYAD